MSGASDTVQVFREFARREGIAVRMLDNGRHSAGGRDREDFAISMLKALEIEFEGCFVLVRKPNWRAVEAAAMGETP